MNNPNEHLDLNRRDFLRGGSLTTLMMLMGGVALKADEKAKAAEPATAYKTTGNPVNCAVIGCGARGREILKTLALLPKARAVAICDTYEPSLRRSKESAPNAEHFTDYRKLLEKKDVQAIILATPSHQHRQIALDTMNAGKHLYCEAPLGNTIGDARAIARAAKEAAKVHFQAGLQMRSDPQRHFLLSFIRSGSMGKTIKARSQWNKKQSWRSSSPNADREKEINWRLRSETSAGLAGEIGIHQIDSASWFINALPVSVSGFGNIMNWNDGRNVHDTIHVDLEYPGGVHVTFDSTLANSFDADYEVFYGTDSAIMLRENKAWMFKEVDSPMLGWEVYARKDTFFKETGIALVANATKIVAQGDKPVEEAPFANTPLFYALEAFLINSDVHQSAVEDFASNFDINDRKALEEYLDSINKNKARAAGCKEGFDATVIAIKANEAILNNQKLTFQKDWFEL